MHPPAAPFRGATQIAFLSVALLAVGCGDAGAEPSTAEMELAESSQLGEQWVRLARDEGGEPIAMQAAIVRYVPIEDFEPDRPADDYSRYVDLVGAVHIGEREYYAQLNRRFESYDKLLYELVAPQGTYVPKGRGTSNSHPLGAMQNGLKSMLDVEHQLERIDYTRSNFVHADLSYDELLKSMEDRDESFLQLYFRLLGASLAQQSQQSVQGESADLDFMSALLSDDRPRRLKIAMAKQLENMETLILALSGPNGSSLITERNNRALDALEEHLGRGADRIGIFYGAAHLPEMHEQIVERFSMRPVAIEWVDAWDLRAK